jgi:hypothetical protein
LDFSSMATAAFGAAAAVAGDDNILYILSAGGRSNANILLSTLSRSSLLYLGKAS